jgi:hypothetical protein
MTGAYDQAIVAAQHALALATAGGDVVLYELVQLLALGKALVLAGRVEEAHALAERALALAQAHQERDQ